MGQAKRRGTREERVQQVVIQRENERLLEQQRRASTPQPRRGRMPLIVATALAATMLTPSLRKRW